ncbi:glycosyltransferase family 2 protein [Patescibacteria group bacterium]|nr:glycosyltransferase family 2 protein [Patescibacteria group bacterium]
MSKIAIQTPLYRSSACLPVLVKSLLAQTHQDWIFYCCENSGDADERAKVADILKTSGIPYVFTESKENLGFAGGHNTLMQQHDAEYILLLNEDAYLAPDHLEKCLQRFALDPEAAAVAGIVYRWTVSADQEERQITDQTMIDTIALEYRCLANVVDACAGQTRKEAGGKLEAARQVMGVSGAICMIRRSLTDRVSPEKLLFDPTFFMYKEDVDLALRLKRKGFHAWFDPAIVSFHRRGVKAPKGIWARIQDERRRPAHLRETMLCNQFKIYAYHLSFRLGVYDLLRSMLHETAHLIFVFISSPLVFVRGMVASLRAWPKAWKRRRILESMGLTHTRFI